MQFTKRRDKLENCSIPTTAFLLFLTFAFALMNLRSVTTRMSINGSSMYTPIYMPFWYDEPTIEYFLLVLPLSALMIASSHLSAEYALGNS
jgi:hypothetical protein